MSSLNRIIKKGRSLSLTDALIGLFIVLLCVASSKVIFLGIGVSLEDYNKYKLFYDMIAGLIGATISYFIIVKHDIAKRREYSRGSI